MIGLFIGMERKCVIGCLERAVATNVSILRRAVSTRSLTIPVMAERENWPFLVQNNGVLTPFSVFSAHLRRYREYPCVSQERRYRFVFHSLYVASYLLFGL